MTSPRIKHVRDVTGAKGWRRGFATLGPHGSSFDLQAYPALLAHLAPLLKLHPEVPVFINYAGMGVDGDHDWRAGLAPLTRLPHVAVTLSRLSFAFRPLVEGKVRDWQCTATDQFGPDHGMIASDFPIDRPPVRRLRRNPRQNWDAVAGFTRAERHALFADTANRLYRLGLELAA